MTRYARSRPRDRNIVLLAVDTPADAALPRGSLNLRPDNSAFAQSTEARQLSPMDTSFAEIKANLLLLLLPQRYRSPPIHTTLAPFTIIMEICPRMIYIILLSFCLRFDVEFFATMKIVGKDVYSCTNLTSGGEVFM